MQSIMGVEGQQFSDVLVAAFFDTDPAAQSTFTAVVDWGDGQRDSVTPQFDQNSNRWQVTGSHTWRKEGVYCHLRRNPGTRNR